MEVETPENKMRIIVNLIRNYERLKLVIDTKTVIVANALTFTITDVSEMSLRLGEIKSEILQKLKELIADFE